MRWQLLTVAIAFSPVVSGQASDQTAAPISCMIGPLTKTIGGNAWLVYACSDGKSLAVVSTPNVAPTWFYFIVAPKGDGYAVSGEANGDKSVTKPVFEELAAMSSDAVAALYQEVQDSGEVGAPGGQPPNNTLERTRDP
jgi:hypothetical protein